MYSLYLPDIGDGLAAGIRSYSLPKIQIDCGSLQCPQKALRKGLLDIQPDWFFLSHFHLDHYNGIFQWKSVQHSPPLSIKHVYFPRLPMFEKNDKFLRCLYAMNNYLLGNYSGSVEADFLVKINRINSQNFKYRALSAGDVISSGHTDISILWPPRTIVEADILKVIYNAITDFECALEENEDLRRIYDLIGEGGIIWPYINEENEERQTRYEKNNKELFKIFRLDYPKRLSKSISKANKSLRHAANHLSLSFYLDKILLFFGDLECYEINKVIQYLVENHLTYFWIIMPPHHGTHWHYSLENIQCYYCASSVGRKLISMVSPKLKKICRSSMATFINGDILVSL
ncbi:hypothetical protein JW935_13690 [candidate division KSB1 bacterium]|nr:hypothetical protein [candidate division KSB1 bacterium]